jgi:transposase
MSDTEGENGPSRRALCARQKLSRRKGHFLHTLAIHHCACVAHEVGRIAIGELSEIQDDENGNGESQNWGKRGSKNRNKKLHG